MSDSNRCPGCGLPGTAEECQQRFEQFLAQDFSDARFFATHRLTVDVYAMQHPERYCESAISFAAHLTGLCVAIEHEDAPKLNMHLQRWLSSRPVLEKPPLPAARGALTIADVDGSDPVRYAESVMRWAKSTWQAYAPLQPLARAWIQAAAH